LNIEASECGNRLTAKPPVPNVAGRHCKLKGSELLMFGWLQ